jgi:hypothetical protein
LKTFGRDSDTLPLVFEGKDGDAGNYDTWEKCWNEVLKKQLEDDPNNQDLQDVNKFFKDGGFDFVKEIETSMDCAGVCIVPLFYATRSISEGKPSNECFGAIVDTL